MTDLKIYILQIVSAAIQGKKLVPRRRGNKIILANSPTIDKNQVRTLKQQEHLHRFSAAASYASTAIANPELEKLYRKKATAKRSRYICAVRDYMRAPEVKSIDTSTYYGNPGSTILVKAKDDFCVKEVTVSIYNSTGRLIEEGNAVIGTIGNGVWTYTATKRVLSHRCTIKAVARDLPNNTGQLEVNYNAFTYRGKSFV
jgi:hypothetical protein